MTVSLRDLLFDGKVNAMHEAMIKEWLLAQRLQNYGYDWREFQRMSAKASRLRKKLRKQPLNFENSAGIYVRLMIDDEGVDYCVGQSFNEEYITLMECLLGLI